VTKFAYKNESLLTAIEGNECYQPESKQVEPVSQVAVHYLVNELRGRSLILVTESVQHASRRVSQVRAGYCSMSKGRS